jgi:hypothetical protein
MDIEILQKEDYVDLMRGEPTVRFTNKGLVFFNNIAVKHLKLWSKKNGYVPVHICRDLKDKSNFGVFVDATGWCLRRGPAGGAVFNCVGLARHVIDVTWERGVHCAGTKKWASYVFRIASLPLDDDKNRDVYALLRRKE